MMKKKLKKILPAVILNGLKKLNNSYAAVYSYCMIFLLSMKKSFGKLIRKIHSPKIPSNGDKKVRIHLGCGDQNHPGFINIDAEAYPHVHYIQDVRKLNNLPGNFADLIYASHVLEHVSFRETLDVLKEWKRVLKHGGTLRLSVPDFDILVQAYQSSGNDIGKIEEPLLGGQNYEYNFHKNAFNEKRLTKLLDSAGFRAIRKWDAHNDEINFNDFAKNFKGSLNMEADKI